MKTTPDPTLAPLDRLVGTWATEATHPAVPGVVVRGTATVERLDGERFLIHRARTDPPDFPDATSIIGVTARDRLDGATGAAPAAGDGSRLRVHDVDSRGVFRVYDVTIDDAAWRSWRDAPGFSPRFTGTWADGGGTLGGRRRLCRDDRRWDDDLEVAYRRRA